MDEQAASPARTRGLLLLGVVFVLGMVCGATLFYLGQRSMLPPLHAFGPDGPHSGGLDRLTRDLNLDPDQRKKIEAILEGRRSRMQQFLEQGRSEIRDILRPDQQKTFDALPHDHGGRHGWRPGPPPEPQPDGTPVPPPDASPGPQPTPVPEHR
jgi:Spy/CpxP family protein refolding chaperone